MRLCSEWNHKRGRGVEGLIKRAAGDMGRSVMNSINSKVKPSFPLMYAEKQGKERFITLHCSVHLCGPAEPSP